ncbi:MAG: hypothetical protein ACTSQA_06845 [Candidatus Heimdallarchaeaceae archaeon]
MPKSNKFKRKKIDVDPLQVINLLTINEGKSHVFTEKDEAAPMKKIVVPKSGGIETYLMGVKYPYPGYPDRFTLEVICIIKKVLLTLFMSFVPLLKKRNMFKLLLIKKELKSFIPKWLQLATWAIRSHRLKPRFYSHSVREIYRVFNVLIEREKLPSKKDEYTKIRDLICMILEFDDAYRFRFQDALSELNLDKIRIDEGDSFYAEKKRSKYDFGGKDNDKIRNDTTIY